jgi:hypothetical protein
MRPHPYLDPDTAAMIRLTEQRLRLMFDDTQSYETLIERGLNFSNRTNVAEKLRLTQSNYFSLELFQSLICGGESYRTGPVNFIWSRLVAARIMIPAFGHMPGAFVDHAIDVPTLLEHLHGETFLNLFAPPSALPERYGNAILAIDVERNGTPYRGSGFIAQSSHDAFPKIVTCRHNIDPADGIVVQSVTTASGRTLKTGASIFSDRYDLCILPLADEVQSPVFRFNKMVEMFDEVFTLGYPSLPGAMPVLTGHKGEVNAIADLYVQRSPAIIISNLVAPGSSGGPVLTADGRCAGMTIRWLEGEMEDGEKTRFSAALPASAIFEEMTRKH